MREFMGHKVRFVVHQLGVVEGTVVDDAKDRILVKGEDDKITRVIKSHICAFTPLDFEPVDYVPFHILRCWNKNTNCPGVRFILEGDRFKATDFETFMSPCPCRSDSCAHGTKGELHSISGSFLRETFADTIYGDYPKKKKEDKSGGTSRKSSGETQQGESESSGVDTGEESDNGGAERTEEASGGTGEAS